MSPNSELRIFSTCPQSSDHSHSAYLKKVIDVARWSEAHGCEGILVYTDNRIADPWLVSQIIIENTERLSPLVAVQPIYLHPYSVAKMVSSLGFLYRRRIYLNMVAGGFVNDLSSLNDTTPHDRRYDRLIEYAQIIKKLCASGTPVSFEGEFYTISNAKLGPPPSPDLEPRFLVSGSSEAGLSAAKAIGATAVKYPKPTSEEAEAPAGGSETGIRIGIIARASEAEAWRVAMERFPETRKGQITHELAIKSSDSKWHEQLSKLAESPETPYWLGPFQNYKTFCPYLVGAYDRVAEEVSRYLELGYGTFILDIPPNAEELESIGRVFELARERVAS
ncbi:MAG TPA: LLM class flavin-dependent oxidoreductase [Terriglobia bacterium]|jgi:alkanesulfonate monooxygenase